MAPIRASRLNAHLANNPVTPAAKKQSSSLSQLVDDDTLAPVGVPLRRSDRRSLDSNLSATPASPQSPPTKKAAKTTNGSKSSSSRHPLASEAADVAAPSTATKKTGLAKKSASKRKVKEVVEEEVDEEEMKMEDERVELSTAAMEDGAGANDGQLLLIVEGNESLFPASALVHGLADDDDARRGKRTKLASTAAAIVKKVPKGVAPRAAKILNKAPPDYSRVMADQSADDSDSGFVFSTHPPTPGAPIIQKAKRKAAKEAGPLPSKLNRQDDESFPSTAALTPSTPAKSSTRHVNLPHRYDPATDISAPIDTAETPQIMRSVRLRSERKPRNNQDGMTPRRQSLDPRGKRASTIGTGFIAVPHPGVPSDKLYRSTDATAPPAVRLRSIMAWLAQRQRDIVFPAVPARTMRGNSAGPSEATRNFAQSIVDEFILDIRGTGSKLASLDFSWTQYEPEDDNVDHPLVQHPQNLVNQAKMAELEQNYAAIQVEDNQREVVDTMYADFKTRREHSQSEASTSTLFDPSLVNFGINLATPASLPQAVELGRTLMQPSDGLKPIPTKKAASRKGKGKQVAGSKDDDVVEVESADVRLQSANFRRITHRLDHFSRQTMSYVDLRISDAHQRLTIDAEAGLLAAPLSEVYQRRHSQQDGPIAEVVRDVDGLIGRAASTSLTSNFAAGPGLDHRDLLRAIAAADGAKGRSMKA